METVYLICAAVGGTLIVCQFLMSMLGLGGDHDAGGGHDVGGHDIGHDVGGGHDAAGHHDVSHGTAPAWYFSLLTLRTLTAATAFFGLAGLASLQAQVESIPSLVIAVAAGAGALVIVAWVMRLITKLNLDGTVRIERSLGARGTVYLPIPAAKAGAGKVLVSFLNRTLEYKAITAQQQLATGAKIVVVGVVGPDTVEVTQANESTGDSHG